MSGLRQKIECCGGGMQDRGVTLFGLLTLSLPLIGVLSLLAPLTWVLARASRPLARAHGVLTTVIAANLRLIREAQVAPMLKCRLSGRVMPYSPWLAGWMFRQFNLIVLSTAFLAAATVLLKVAS